jgi:hypothetical protein
MQSSESVSGYQSSHQDVEDQGLLHDYRHEPKAQKNNVTARYLSVIGGRQRPQRLSFHLLNQHWATLALFAFTVLFAVAVLWYIFEILTSTNPAIGNLPVPSPSVTLLIITILSQLLVLFSHLLMVRILDVLRWRLVSRNGGVDALTFFVLGSATSLTGAFNLARKSRGWRRFWSGQKSAALSPQPFNDLTKF